MKPFVKFGAVLAGYVIAVLAAGAALEIRLLNTQGPDAQASAGMYAFGDFLLFVAVFSSVALFPTGLMFYFLRPYRWIWIVLAIAGLALALTGVLAVAIYTLARPMPHPGDLWMMGAAFAVLRMLAAPLLAVALVIAGLISSHRSSRWALLAAGAMESIVAAYAVVVWYVP